MLDKDTYLTLTGLRINIRIIIWTRRKIKKRFLAILLYLLPCQLLLANQDTGGRNILKLASK
jgi:hypothetical protein